jgi:hypothetical protein
VKLNMVTDLLIAAAIHKISVGWHLPDRSSITSDMERSTPKMTPADPNVTMTEPQKDFVNPNPRNVNAHYRFTSVTVA